MKKSIIIYFSRADENYAVGYINKGNTEVIAEYIKEYTNSDIFKVEPLNSYPVSYMDCIEEAKKELWSIMLLLKKKFLMFHYMM